MPLHLAHHKSYHPYKRDNIERVKRDEEAAQLEEEAAQARTLAADSEARLALLRKRAKGKQREEDDERIKAAERAIDGRGNGTEELESWDKKKREQLGQEKEAHYESNGHINFWADIESANGVSRVYRLGPSEYSADLASSMT